MLFAVNTRPLKSYLSHSPTNVLQWLKCIMNTQYGHSFDQTLGGLKIIHFVVNIIQILEMLCLTIRYHFQLRQSADANFANLFCPIKKKKLCRFVLKPARGIASGWSSLTASN